MNFPRLTPSRWLLLALVLAVGALGGWSLYTSFGSLVPSEGESASRPVAAANSEAPSGSSDSTPADPASGSASQIAPASAAYDSATTLPPAGVEEIMRAAQARRESKPSPADRPPRTSPGRVWSEPVSAEDGGQPQVFVLALDEVMVRGAEGKDRLAAVAASSPDELETMIDAMSASTGETVAAVLYPEGDERNEYTRRLLSPLITVKLSAGADAAAIASKVGAVDYELPDYAPGFAVLRTPGGLDTFDVAEALRGTDGVEFAEVQLASLPQKKAMPNDTLINQQWHLKFNSQSGAVAGTDINVENVWAYPTAGAGHRGRGVIIGIVDDGVQVNHPDLAANVDLAKGKDWNGNDNDPSPETGDDHGTACAGDAAAVGNNNLGVSGSAPEAKLVGMRLIAASVSDSQEAEAMNYLPQDIQILSNSWGPSDNGTLLSGPRTLTRAALQTATTTGRAGRGTISMWAGGNGLENDDDSNADGYANSIYTIAVSAFDSQARQAYYSEPGANIVITSPSNGRAPALGKTTTDRTGSAGYVSGDYESNFGGTSSATPTAAGVVALMLEANPNLGWRDVQEILMRSAKKVNPADPDWKTPVAPDNINHSHKFGGGLIDAQAAVTMAQGWANLGAQTSRTASTTGLPVNIPDNDPTGISRTFTVSDDLRVEHVTVTVSATHPYRGDLVFVLTSPSGTRSTLIDRPGDNGANYSNWTFSSVRHWGERSAGTWTLTVSDTGADDIGSLTAASLAVFGVGEATSTDFLETFDTSNATASYLDGSFVGVDGITWSYGHSRNEGDFPIVEQGLMLRRASDSYLEAVFPSGVGSFSFEYRKAFTGNSSRQLEVLVNGVQVVTSPTFGTTPAGADPTIFTLSHPINTPGPVTVRIKLTGTAETNRQTTIDNISWTSFGETTEPLISSFSPEIGPIGTSVTINGVNFGASPVVKFNGVTATSSSVNGSGTVITATVPEGATSGPITVEVAGQPTATSASDFAVGLPPPSVTATPSAITGLNTSEGIASTSSSYSLVASNLTGDLVVAPSNAAFEVSTDDDAFGPSVTVPQTGGSASATIYVRLAATAPVGAATGTIANSVEGSGTPFASTPSLSGSVVGPPVGDLVAGWDFQTTANGGTAVAASPATPKVLIANFGSATLYANGSNGSSDWFVPETGATGAELTAFGGTAVNTAGTDLSTETSGASAFAVLGGAGGTAANGKSMVFRFSMVGLQDLNISLAAQRTATGFNEQVWEYSTDGATWSSIGTLVAGTTAGTLTTSFTASGVLSLPAISALDNVADAYVRVTFNGATAATGNNRLDNIQFRATPSGVVPSITLSTDSLSGFDTTQGAPSAAQSFDVSGENLTDDIAVTAPANYELSLTENGTYANSVTIEQSGGIAAATPVFVRIASTAATGDVSGNLAATSTGATTRNVAVAGNVAPLPPDVTVSVTSLPAFSTNVGEPSDTESFTVQGERLISNLLITAPTGFEIFQDAGSSWETNLVLVPDAGSIALTTITVRIAADALPPSVGGNITILSTGVSHDVEVSGTVTIPPAITVDPPTIDSLVAVQNQAGTAQSFQVSGVSLEGELTVEAPAGFEVSTTSATAVFGPTATIPASGLLEPTDVWVRIAVTASAGPVGPADVTITGGGAATPGTVTVSGTVTDPDAPAISVEGVLSALSTIYGTPSSSTDFEVAGVNMTEGILVTPPPGFEVSTDDASFDSTVTVGAVGTIDNTTVYVRLAANADAGAYSGNIVLTSDGALPVNVPTVQSTVAAKELAIIGVTAANKVYDGTTAATLNNDSAELDGVLPGDTVTLETGAASGDFDNAEVGTDKPVTASGYALGGASSSNYSPVQPSGLTANITQATPIVTTPPTAANLQPGQTLGDSALNGGEVTGVGDVVLAGTFVWTDPNFLPPLGTGSYEVTFTPIDTNYTTATPTVSVTVSEAPAITVDPAELQPFSTTVGAASRGEDFDISGTNLTADVTVTPPEGFEVSRDGISYQTASLTIPSSDFAGPFPLTLAARLSGASQGSFTGSIAVASEGAAPQTVAVSGRVFAPSLEVAPALLPEMTTVEGTPSLAESFTITGSDFFEDIIITPPSGFAVSVGGAPFSESPVAIPPDDFASPTAVEVRLTGAEEAIYSGVDVTVASSGLTASVAVSGTVDPAPAVPTITVDPESLSGFDAEEGTASEPQIVTVSGVNLEGPITVTAPDSYELSRNGTDFFDTVVLTPVAPQSIAPANAEPVVIASDTASNYGDEASNTWGDGSNEGFGFGPWQFNVVDNSGGTPPPPFFAGAFIGDPADALITSFPAPAFGLYANPGGTPAEATLNREFAAPLQVGDTFSFQWATNWDSDVGNKGFSIFAGEAEVVNVNQGGFPGDITLNGVDTGLQFGTGPMTWTFTMTSSGNLRVTSTARDGTTTPVFTADVVLPSAPTSFRWYVSAMGPGDQRQPYFNNLQITSGGGGGGGDVPETAVIVRLTADAPLGEVTGNLEATSPNADPRTVALSGTVNPRPPQLSVDPDVLSGLEAFVGTSGGAESFDVSGVDLVENVTVTAPANFEVSLDGSDFDSEVSIEPEDGGVNRAVFVRIGAVAETGPVNGTVTLTSTTASASVEVAGEVFAVPVGPTIVFAPLSGIEGLLTTQGTDSAPLSATINGFNLLGNITAEAPAGLEVSLTEDSGFGPAVDLVPTEGRVTNASLYVRIAANAPEGLVDTAVLLVSEDAADQSLPVLGNVLPQPVISVVPDSLELFRTVVGLQPPAQSLSVSGTSLAGPVTVTVPTGYQFFVNGVVVAASSFTPAIAGNFQIDVVLTAIDQPGTPGGDMTFTSPGAVPVVIALEGLVLPRPVVSADPGEVGDLTARLGFPSEEPGEFTVSGSDLLQDLLVEAPENFELSLDGTTWAETIALEPVYDGEPDPNAPPVILASDNAGNYGDGWTSGSNGGTGFGAWAFDNNDDGLEVFAGSFTGSSTDGGGNIDTEGVSFALYANPAVAFATADRDLAAPLQPGESLRVQLALNFDNGNKGLNVFTGGAGSTQLFNFNVGGGASVNAGDGLTLNAGPGQGYDYGGAAVLEVTVTYVTETELAYVISRTSPEGNQGVLFSGTITSESPFGAPDGLRLYNSGTENADGVNNLYFNNLQILAPGGTGGVVDPTTVYVRIAATAPLGPVDGIIDVTSGEFAEPRTVAVSGEVVRPEISVSPASLTFVAAEGDPSTPQFIVVSGENLVNPIAVGASAGYEVALVSNTDYAPSVELTPVDGAVQERFVYVRVAASAPSGSLEGNVALTSAGSELSPSAEPRTVSLTGSVEPWPVVNPLSLRVLQPAAALSTTNASFAFVGQAGVGLTNAIRWSNSLTGQTNSLARDDNWTAEVPLGVGTNNVTFLTTYRTYDTNNVVRVGFDTPDNSAYLNGWTNGSSGGFGFAAWQLSATGSATNFRTTSATNLNLARSIAAFTLRGGSDLEDTALAHRRLEAALVPASSFEIELDSNELAQGGALGVELADGEEAKVRFFAEAVSGQPSVFRIEDAAGLRTDTVPYTTNGFLWRFELLSPTDYRLTVTPNVGGSATIVTGSIEPGAIDTLVLSNRAGGATTANNFYAGRMQVHSPSFTDTTVTVIAPIVVRTAEPPADGYAQWAASYGLDPATDGAPGEDPDGDGFSNAMEFAFGTNPTEPTGSLMTTAHDGGDLVVTYAERDQGVSYAVQSTSDLALGPWVDAEVTVELAGDQQGVPEGYRLMEFRVRASGNAFYRVEAGLP